ncbi:MAG: choice-of-anchor B family protein [Rhodothermales bacterium]
MSYRAVLFACLAVFAFVVLPVQAQTTFSDAPQFGLGFGGSVAIGEQEIFVSSGPVGWPRGEEPAEEVYVYQSNGKGWDEVARLQAPDAQIGDIFGRSLLAEDGMLVVGAPGVEAAYVFERDDMGNWAATGTLRPSALPDGAEFGGAYDRGGMRTGVLAMVGDRIVVTAFGGSQTGTAHVFAKSDGQWMEEAVLRPTDDAAAGFGLAVAGDDERIYVSAPMAGAVYAYGLVGEEWAMVQRLAATELPPRSGFGQAIAAEGNTVYIGAPRTGTVYAYMADDEGILTLESRITAPASEDDPARGFGATIALDGDRLAVSAMNGRVLLFDNGTYFADLVPPTERSSAGFGIGLALRDDVVVVGSPRADYEEGIATVFERNAEVNRWTAVETLVSDVALYESMLGDTVECEDGQASVFECDGVDMVAFMSSEDLTSDRGVKMTDIWGWEDPQTGVEYVLLARTDGTAFIDISNPSMPVYVGQIMKTASSPGSAWRDVKVYKDHAYIVADGAEAHGIQIFDLTQLRDVDPSEMPKTFDETARYDGVHSTHNIVINEETGFAYAVGNRAGGETCGGQLHIVDIREPANPKFAGCFTHPNAGGTHDSQCVTYRGPDSDYTGREICLNSNGGSFIIADVTDKENTKTIVQATYPNTAYTHQGWLTEDQRYFYMNDELDELSGSVEGTRTLVWDVADLDDPVLINEFIHSTLASDHNLYVRGNRMYQSNYQSGLRILDITNPEEPAELAHFDTVPGKDEPGFGGSWSNYPYFKSGIIAVSSRGEGLFLLRVQKVDI